MLVEPFGPRRIGGSDGRSTAVPIWSLGDVIPLGHRALRVIGKRDDDADQPPVLVVEEVA
jgi:hypothetical protein